MTSSSDNPFPKANIEGLLLALATALAGALGLLGVLSERLFGIALIMLATATIYCLSRSI